jgi:hypothetical protein
MQCEDEAHFIMEDKFTFEPTVKCYEYEAMGGNMIKVHFNSSLYIIAI